MASATITDVARRAGVSTKTVSRVLNAEPHVRESVRDNVLKAALDLRYRPKTSARSLAGARSYMVGYLLSHFSPYGVLAQLGALRGCRRAGYHLLVEAIDLQAPDLGAELDDLLQALGVDGVMLLQPLCDNETVMDALDRAEIAYVRISAAKERAGSPLIEVDDEAAAQVMTEHLIGLGHRRIGFITGAEGHSATTQRLAGFRAAIKAAGLDGCEELIRPGAFTFATGRDAAQALLSLPEPPTAIFASNDEMAQGVIVKALELGLQLPRSLSVAGFDDIHSAATTWPPLTTMRQPVEDMAAAATQLIIAGAGRGPRPESSVPRFHCELVVRGSTAPPG